MDETVDHLRLEIDGCEIRNPAVQLRCFHGASPNCDLVINLSPWFGQQALSTQLQLVHNHISLQFHVAADLRHCNPIPLVFGDARDMNKPFDGQVVVITGGARGIGYA
ncbi:hypothetical protein EON81_29735, partial [bacterium]